MPRTEHKDWPMGTETRTSILGMNAIGNLNLYFERPGFKMRPHSEMLDFSLTVRVRCGDPDLKKTVR